MDTQEINFSLNPTSDMNAITNRQFYRQLGVTLLELMAAVAILAIITVVAASTYQSQILKAHRIDAKNAIMALAAREEQYYSAYNTYTNSPSALGYAASVTAFPVAVTSNSGSRSYYSLNVTVTAATTSPYAPAAFTVTATATGSQTADTNCQTFQVNSLGVQTSAPSTTACF